MTEPIDLQREIKRMLKVADQSVTAHSVLRDRLNRRALLLDLLVLVLSAIVAVGTFTSESTFGVLMPGVDQPRIIVGMLAIGVFLFSLVQFKVGWKETASAHSQSARALAHCKAEIRAKIYSSSTITLEEFNTISALYNTSSSNIAAIPDDQFVSLKAVHRKKIKISRILDRHPHLSLTLVRLKLWVRDTIRADDGTD